MKFAQLVIGPAGSGKSTFCETMKQFCDSSGRSLHLANLDPAAEVFNYPVSIDVRELISLDEAMDELDLGPNGGLLYCMEYLEENLQDWLHEQLSAYGDDDYIFFDCPGQIELYSHLSVFQSIIRELRADGWHVGCVYCLDAQFTEDASKYIAGCLTALSSMVQLELPHVNVLTKIDLLGAQATMYEDGLVIPDGRSLLDSLDSTSSPKFQKLNAAVASLLEDYSMVAFVPLDITDEDSIEMCMLQVDMSVQYGEDQDVKIPDEEAPLLDDDPEASLLPED